MGNCYCSQSDLNFLSDCEKSTCPRYVLSIRIRALSEKNFKTRFDYFGWATHVMGIKFLAVSQFGHWAQEEMHLIFISKINKIPFLYSTFVSNILLLVKVYLNIADLIFKKNLNAFISKNIRHEIPTKGNQCLLNLLYAISVKYFLNFFGHYISMVLLFCIHNDGINSASATLPLMIRESW